MKKPIFIIDTEKYYIFTDAKDTFCFYAITTEEHTDLLKRHNRNLENASDETIIEAFKFVKKRENNFIYEEYEISLVNSIEFPVNRMRETIFQEL